MAAGAARIIEISFVLDDRSTFSPDGSDPHSFQYVTPFMLCASGFLFMGATEEQMQVLANHHVTHVAYILILFSCAFILFLFVNTLLHIYAVHSWPESARYDISQPTTRLRNNESLDFAHSLEMNNLHDSSNVAPAQQVRDAQEFELEGLIGGDDRGFDGEEDIGEPGPTGRPKDLESARVRT
ncbi:hypothetical protein KEM55_004563 [Ascosphaera atra]|nr:hypothetical protein KEM55_004563 [Ascosphaera atra]